ncbi:hypothetical protein [Saccharomonospora saliphila]|uniref:hypothetical protein n=1 Tax=Saccharomonospora saliphila TaxID=369829 RepID=UPI000490B5E2|nr:hypothetical protein [Saccharomonospora saliphila]
MPGMRRRPARESGNLDDGHESEQGTGTGAFDPFDPQPDSRYELPAAELRAEAESGPSGLLRWRRQTTSAPIVEVKDRYITGRLDLRAAELGVLFRFERCRFEYSPDVREATLLGLSFRRCWLPGLKARNFRSRNDVRLIRCVVEVDRDTDDTETTVRSATGLERGVPDAAVNLTDAVIEGSVVLTRTRVTHPRGKALQGDRLVITGALLAYRLRADGEVRLPGLRTGGNVNFSGAALSNPDGFALNGNGLHVGGSLLCEVDTYGTPAERRAFSANGMVFVPSLRVAGDLVFRGARLKVDLDGEVVVDAWKTGDWYVDPHPALIADRMRVEGNVEVSDHSTITGTLRMVNAYVGGSMRLASTSVTVRRDMNPPYNDRAIHLDGSEIHGDLDGNGLRTSGQFRFADVRVRGNLFVRSGTFDHARRDVVSARRSEVSGNVMLVQCTARGTLRLQGMTVGGSIDLSGLDASEPEREAPRSWAVDLRSVRVARSLVLDADRGRTFRARGGVTLDGAVVSRSVSIDGAELLAGDTDKLALDASDASADEFALTPGIPPHGRVSLRNAHCGTLTDNAALWQADGHLELDGFRYDALDEPIGLRDDAAVLRRLRRVHDALDGYRPGPYDQLATMLRASGNEEHADTVLLAKQQYRYESLARGYRVFGFGVRVWSWLQRWMVGYGYRPVRALAWLFMLLLAGSLWFGLGTDDCVTDTERFTASGPRCVVNADDTGLEWNPVFYTVDLLVPIADFGNKGRWHMDGADKWVSAGFTAMGWVLATTVAAGVTRTLRRTTA